MKMKCISVSDQSFATVCSSYYSHNYVLDTSIKFYEINYFVLEFLDIKSCFRI